MAFYAKLMAGKVDETTQPGGIDVVPIPSGYKLLEIHAAATATGARGLKVSGAGDWYTGEPPEMLVDRPDVSIRTPEGLPWPRSAEDRFCKYPEREQRARADGKPHRGPLSMAQAAASGTWPTDLTRQWSAYVETKLADPMRAARALLGRQGIRGAEAERRATIYAERVAPGGPPNLAALIEHEEALTAEAASPKPKPEPKPEGRKAAGS